MIFAHSLSHVQVYLQLHLCAYVQSPTLNLHAYQLNGQPLFFGNNIFYQTTFL